jgi:hypothetical protein
MAYPESHWNYRLYQHGDGTIVIVECYYRDGEPYMHNDGARVVGDSKEECLSCWNQMGEAFETDIVTADDFQDNDAEMMFDLDNCE